MNDDQYDSFEIWEFESPFKVKFLRHLERESQRHLRTYEVSDQLELDGVIVLETESTRLHINEFVNRQGRAQRMIVWLFDQFGGIREDPLFIVENM